MGTPGSAPDITREDVRGVFTQFERQGIPITAADVADALDCSQRTARRALDELTESGEVERRELADGTRVWWQPDGDDRTGSESPDEAEFAAFVSAVRDYAIFMLDPEGTVVNWNDGAERIKGYRTEEIVGEHVSTFYTDGDTEAGVPEENLEAAADAGRVEDEGWRVRKDGTRFWAHVTITAIRDDDGTLRGFTKVTRDMTERREYEQRLRRERDFTERILETIPVGTCVLSPDGSLTRANRRLLTRLEIDDAALSEYTVDSWEVYDEAGDRIPPADRPWAEAFETGDPVYDYRCQLDAPNGDRRWVSLNAAPLEDGEDRRVILSLEDITEQKERERQLRQQYRQTEQLLRTAPVAIAVQNSDRETVMANRRAQEVFDLSEAEFTANPVDTGEWKIYDADGNRLEPEETTSARVLESGEPVFDEELIFELPNGDRRHYRVNTVPVYGPDGTIDRIITAGKDITELKERERQLEQRKAELETELNGILGRISDAFYALDDDWQLTHLNDRAAELLGQPAEELLGREIWDVLPETDDEIYRTKFRTAMETQEPLNFEVYEDGTESWLEFSVYPSESGLSIYFRDVTARVEREQELTKYETIVETINDGIYVKDEDGYFTMVNEAYAELTGYDRTELVGEHASLVVDEETITESRDQIAAGVEAPPAMETELQTASGDRVPVEGTFATLQTGDSHEEIGVVRDVTERKERERALRERERRLKEHKEFTDDVLNAVDDLFYLIDADGNLQRWNESVNDVTGNSDAEIESMTALDFFDEEHAEQVAATIADGFETGDLQIEAKIRTRDGEEIPYEFTASTLEDPDGNEVLTGIGRDITDRLEYEHQLEASNERLEQFAYAASHDLQEPLRMVTSYLQLLENRYGDDLDDDAEEFIDFAVDGAERMRQMIDGLLQYSRVETRGDPFESIDLNDVLDETLENLELQIDENQAEVVVDSLPTVRGDASQLQQVFQNLVSNAIEYSGDEPPEIRIAAERNGAKYVISVHDDGIGIDPEDQDRIFEVFHRLHTHEEHPGTGIGLALCRRIIERHGGEIWVDSEPGNGTTFSFTLPPA
ncbi:PAS domain S-box protein [Halopiger aswanensis]|uniref:histidine kinase n=1 Tax=Halopiger aswanensis TaxID=148449 RepID=A0A3R7KIU7_9EURY|nr:PAS domain S-box protein [Halopiger aswanensis]RKD88934.1 PAS domain S-box-containing protein [Halopiger aswanensis]